jgi:hypothetical protein
MRIKPQLEFPVTNLKLRAVGIQHNGRGVFRLAKQRDSAGGEFRGQHVGEAVVI